MGSGARSHALRAIVIDDEEPVRALVRLALDRSGLVTVVGEADGTPTSVATACALRPEVVLLDQNLGAIRGTELIGTITRSCPSAMIAMLTALDPVAEEPAARSAGAFVFYEKSVIATSLAQFIVEDHELFCGALEGREVVAPSALARRAGTGAGRPLSSPSSASREPT